MNIDERLMMIINIDDATSSNLLACAPKESESEKSLCFRVCS